MNRLKFSILWLSILAVFLFPQLFAEYSEEIPIRIFYHCSPSILESDSEGRGGLPTLSSFIDREKEKAKQEGGVAYLFGMGSFYRNSANRKEKPEFLNSVPYDGIFLDPTELSSSPSENLSFPLFAVGAKGYASGKNFFFKNLAIEVRETNSKVRSKSLMPDLRLLFETDQIPEQVDIKEIVVEDSPSFLFYDSSKQKLEIPNEKTGAWYNGGIEYLPCPNSIYKVGKLDLVFRNNRLIRQTNEIVDLNSKEVNKNWIPRKEETKLDLEKN